MSKEFLVPLVDLTSQGFVVFDYAELRRVTIHHWSCVRQGERYYLKGKLIGIDDEVIARVEFPSGQVVSCELSDLAHDLGSESQI
jgi:predicted oxidoreductase